MTTPANQYIWNATPTLTYTFMSCNITYITSVLPTMIKQLYTVCGNQATKIITHEYFSNEGFITQTLPIYAYGTLSVCADDGCLQSKFCMP